MTVRKTTLSVFIALFASACMYAQTVTGSMVGVVVDPAGSVIPSAKITLTNLGTAAANTATSDGSGVFRFPNLSAANYSVTVQASGFKTRVVTDIVLGLRTAESCVR